MQKGRSRKNERGAAMVMVLMVSALLLAAAGGILLEASMNTANISDATAEQQAYNAAESGIQSAINVLRGNTTASILLNPSSPSGDPSNIINFRRAVTAGTSNLPGDPSTAGRLSRWMNYNYSENNATIGDRVTLTSPDRTYSTRRDNAFEVTVSDPDNTGSIISFSTQCRFRVNNEWQNSVTFGTAPNTVTISFLPATLAMHNNLNVTSGSVNTDFGSFQISTTGTGGTVPTDIPFEVTINFVAPYNTAKSIYGKIKPGAVTTLDVGQVKFDFESRVMRNMGNTITLEADPLTPNAPTISSGITPINGNITQFDPFRVVITSVGYGPRGAKKILEATVRKNFFNGMSAPSPLTLIGASNGAVFEPGSSTGTTYSGVDVVNPTELVPPIGTTNSANLALVMQRIQREPPHPFNGDIVGTPSDVTYELPFWLQNTTNLNETIDALRLSSQPERYFANGTTPNAVGDGVTGRGITFVDGDFTLTGSGGGILVVTGKLTLHGNFSFKGLIIVTGEQGVDRRGGGNGEIQGNIVVAPYNQNNLAAGFLSPKYDLSGGGNSTIRYNSSSVADGMLAVSNFVLAVAEK